MTWQPPSNYPPASPDPGPGQEPSPYGNYGTAQPAESASQAHSNPYANLSGSQNPYADASGRPAPQPPVQYGQQPTQYTTQPTQYTSQPGYLVPGGLPVPGAHAATGPTRGRGKMTALIAMLGVLGVLVVAVAAANLLAPDHTRGSGYVADSALQPGMCLESLTYGYGNGLPQVPCTRVHQLEVLDSKKVRSVFGYPGLEPMQDRATSFCQPLAAKVQDKTGVDVEPSTLFPTEESWASGDRLLTCMITPPAGRFFTGAQANGDLRLAS